MTPRIGPSEGGGVYPPTLRSTGRRRTFSTVLLLAKNALPAGGTVRQVGGIRTQQRRRRQKRWRGVKPEAFFPLLLFPPVQAARDALWGEGGALGGEPRDGVGEGPVEEFELCLEVLGVDGVPPGGARGRVGVMVDISGGCGGEKQRLWWQ